MVLAIKELLYQRGYTIAGARKLLSGEKKKLVQQAELPFADSRQRERLRRLRDGLRSVIEMLEK